MTWLTYAKTGRVHRVIGHKWANEHSGIDTGCGQILVKSQLLTPADGDKVCKSCARTWCIPDWLRDAVGD